MKSLDLWRVEPNKNTFDVRKKNVRYHGFKNRAAADKLCEKLNKLETKR